MQRRLQSPISPSHLQEQKITHKSELCFAAIFKFWNYSQHILDNSNYDYAYNQPAKTCSKLAIETLEQGVKYANGVVLVSLLFTLNIFYTLF